MLRVAWLKRARWLCGGIYTATLSLDPPQLFLFPPPTSQPPKPQSQYYSTMAGGKVGDKKPASTAGKAPASKSESCKCFVAPDELKTD